jgi:hypothetical protein
VLPIVDDEAAQLYAGITGKEGAWQR